MNSLNDFYSIASKTIVSNLKSHNINFLAIDFDLTLVSIHTCGRWPGTADDLSTKVRPFFEHFIPAALDENLLVAVVTFSPQVELINCVIRKLFPNHGDKIPVRGNDEKWVYNGCGCKDGKQAHIASAVQELESRPEKPKIVRGSTLLLDDDQHNIDLALRNFTFAIHCDPDYPEGMVDTLLAFVPLRE